jgi:hypothetical protein
MKTTVYWLNSDINSRIGIMPRPRGGDWLEDEIRSLRDSNVDIVVSLLEQAEIDELDLRDEPGCCENYGILDEVLDIKCTNNVRWIVDLTHNGAITIETPKMPQEI